MKKCIFLTLITCLCFLASCQLGSTKTEEPEKWVNPIANVQVSEDTCNVDKLAGTYEMYDQSTMRYYYVSLCTDGTVICVPISWIYTVYDDSLSFGEWSLSDTKTLNISMLGKSYGRRTMSDLINTSTGKKVGFSFRPFDSSNYLKFEKISDNYISQNLYMDKSLLYDCYWVRTDDYGVSYAYKFYADGKYEYYRSNRSDGFSTSDYSISTTGCKIKLDSSSLYTEYNFCIIDDFLYLGSTSYKCVGKEFPVNKDSEELIRDTSIREKTLGIWILSDLDDKEDVYDFISDGTVFRVGCYAEGHQYRESGTWWVESSVLKFTFGSSTSMFSPVFEEKDDTVYMSGFSLGTFERIYSNDYILGDYKGRPDGTGNLLSGSWIITDALSFTFKSNGTGTVNTSGTISAITWSCENNNDNRLTVKLGENTLIDNAQWCLISENPMQYPVKMRLMLNLNKTSWSVSEES